MKSEITKEGSPKKKYRLYIFAAFLAVIMALSCVAIFASDSEDVAAEGDVARIGETGYATLESALAAAQNNDTVEILADCTYTGGYEFVFIDKEITLDGNAHIITMNATRANITADVTFTDVTFVAAGTDNLFDLRNDSAVNVTFNNVIFQGTSSVSKMNFIQAGGIGDYYLKGVITITGCTFDMTDSMVNRAVRAVIDGGSVVVNDTTFIGVGGDKDTPAKVSGTGFATALTGSGNVQKETPSSEAAVMYAVDDVDAIAFTTQVDTYTVTYNISNAQSIVGGMAVYHQAFESATITPNDHYVVPASVTVTMGGAAFDQFSYENGKVTIAAGLIQGNLVITGECAGQTYAVTFGVAGNGTVDATSVSVPYGSAFTVSDKTVTINGTTVTVTIGADNEKYTYTFEGWNVKNGDTVVGDTAVAAIVTEFTKPATTETAVEFISDSTDETVTASVDVIKSSDKDNVVIGKDSADDKWSVELPKSYFSDKTDSVSVTVKDVSEDLPDTIPAAQKEKLAGMTVVSLDMVIGEQTQHQFGQKVSVKLAYTLKEGQSADKLFVYYVNTATGALEKYDVTYADGFVTFETDHFSFWAIGEDNASTTGGNNQGLLLAVLLVAAIVAPIIVALVVFRKN